MVFAVKKCSLN